MSFFLLRSSICLTAYCMSLKIKTKSPGGLLDNNTAAVFAQCIKSMKSHKVFKSGIKLCHFPCTIPSCVQYETSVWKIFSFNDIAHNNWLSLGPVVTKRQCKLIRIHWKEWEQFTFCSSGMNFMDDCYPTCLYEFIF